MKWIFSNIHYRLGIFSSFVDFYIFGHFIDTSSSKQTYYAEIIIVETIYVKWINSSFKFEYLTKTYFNIWMSCVTSFSSISLKVEELFLEFDGICYEMNIIYCVISKSSQTPIKRWKIHIHHISHCFFCFIRFD